MSANIELTPLILNENKNVTFYEIGVCRATNMVELVKACPNITEIVGIDSYLEYTETLTSRYKVSAKLNEYNKSVAIDRINHSEHKDKLRLWVIDSNEAALQTEDKSIDVVFLDAYVVFGQVTNDVLAWHPKVKDGGILCGHDWYSLAIQKEVYETLESLGYAKEDVKTLANEVWWIRKNK